MTLQRYRKVLTVSDTIILATGLLLTSTALLALTPYMVRQLREWMARRDAGGDFWQPALAAAHTVFRPNMPWPRKLEEHLGEPLDEGLDELAAHLFGLRMAVGEITAEIGAVREVLSDHTPDAIETSSPGIAYSGDRKPTARDVA